MAASGQRILQTVLRPPADRRKFVGWLTAGRQIRNAPFISW
jgi:hypothetical protein